MDVYTWGSNKFKQISRKNELHIYAPTAQTDLASLSVCQVAAGDHHTLILTDYGDVYSQGKGREGQLGHGSKCGDAELTCVSSLAHETVVDIACGSQTSYAVTATGQLYQWGLVHTTSAKAAKHMMQQHKEALLNSNSSSNTSSKHFAKDWDNDEDVDGNEDDDEEEEDEQAAASGQLTGIAQDQSFVVPVDSEARQTQSQSLGVQSAEKRNNAHSEQEDLDLGLRPGASRQLRDIVRDSTERWLMANDNTHEMEQQFLRELHALGYRNEEINYGDIQQQRSQQSLSQASSAQHAQSHAHGNGNAQSQQQQQQQVTEYQGMLRLGCKRVCVSVPMRVRGLDHLKIVCVSAGYAHAMILTQSGHLFAAGYNDRGQLGLGHRISTSQFKAVEHLASQFVIQVSCGQQHTLCRAIDRVVTATNATCVDSSDSDNVKGALFVGSNLPTNVYVWGNGMLGQLGLGRRGTSKGALLPTLIPTLAMKNTLSLTQAQHAQGQGIKDWRGAVDVCAGHNFSVCVGDCGRVFSWGHAEYNQHGTGWSAASDHIDAFYYYVPREVDLTSTLSHSHSHSGQTQQSHPKIVKVTCGATFTIATDNMGSIYSWGWNESGVLGHGIGHFSSAPTKIGNLGADTRHTHASIPVTCVCAGSKHVIALASEHGHTQQSSHSSTHAYFRALLDSSTAQSGVQTHADCFIKVSGYNDFVVGGGNGVAAGTAGTQQQDAFVFVPCHKIILACRSSYLQGLLRLLENSTPPCTDGNNAGDESTASNVIDLSDTPCASVIAVRALLEYLYLDKVNVVAHKRKHLLELAQQLCVTRLVALLSATTAQAAAEVPPSTFVADLRKAINNPLYADVVLRRPDTGAVVDDKGDKAEVLVYGHKVMLSQSEYFASLFSSGFCDTVTVASPARAHTPMHQPTASDCSDGSAAMSEMYVINTQGFVEDGMEIDSLLSAVAFAYTGELLHGPVLDACLQANNLLNSSDSDQTTTETAETFDAEDLTHTMSLLVVAYRLSFTSLAHACERLLCLHLRDYFPENAQNCLLFARSFGFTRLERKCEEALRRGGAQ